LLCRSCTYTVKSSLVLVALNFGDLSYEIVLAPVILAILLTELQLTHCYSHEGSSFTVSSLCVHKHLDGLFIGLSYAPGRRPVKLCVCLLIVLFYAIIAMQTSGNFAKLLSSLTVLMRVLVKISRLLDTNLLTLQFSEWHFNVISSWHAKLVS